MHRSFALTDYPIARFEPMDSGGAYLLGASTFEAVETEIIRQCALCAGSGRLAIISCLI